MAVHAKPVEASTFREAAHFHGILEWLARSADLGTGVSVDDTDHLEVEVGGKTAVQLQFGGAASQAPVERAIVKKGQDDGLLDLVGETAGEEYPGGVRFDQVNCRCRFGVAAGVQKGTDQRW